MKLISSLFIKLVPYHLKWWHVILFNVHETFIKLHVEWPYRYGGNILWNYANFLATDNTLESLFYRNTTRHVIYGRARSTAFEAGKKGGKRWEKKRLGSSSAIGPPAAPSPPPCSSYNAAAKKKRQGWQFQRRESNFSILRSVWYRLAPQRRASSFCCLNI